MSEQDPTAPQPAVPETSIPGFGQPRSVGEALAASDQNPPQAPVAAAAPEEGSTPIQAPAEAHEATQGADVAGTSESATERRARLQRELAETQEDIDRENAERLANASDEEKCPTCGQLPPPADPPAGAREIWCPDCGQRLADLPAGH